MYWITFVEVAGLLNCRSFSTSLVRNIGSNAVSRSQPPLCSSNWRTVMFLILGSATLPPRGLTAIRSNAFASRESCPARMAFLTTVAVIGLETLAIRIRASGGTGFFLASSIQP